MTFGLRTPRFLVAPLVALLALAGCSDSTAVDDTVHIVRLNIGTQTILFNPDGLRNCCDGAGDETLNTRITLANTGSVTARTHQTVATFHRSDGTPIRLDPGSHELRVSTSGPEVTWTPNATDSFRGAFFRNGVAVITAEMSIVHTPSGQTIHGPHTFWICTTSRATSADPPGSNSVPDPAVMCNT